MDAEARAAGPPIPIDQVGEIIFRRAAWLDTGCIVSPRVEVGAETIVAAGNVVTKNLPPEVLAAGVPARALRPIAASRYGSEFGNSLELKVV
jgi:acetyltransferase-like isoleucine patch superfamily enzyme